MCYKCYLDAMTDKQEKSPAKEVTIFKIRFKNNPPVHFFGDVIVEAFPESQTDFPAVKLAGVLLELVDGNKSPEWINEVITSIPDEYIKSVINAYCGKVMSIQEQYHDQLRAVLYGLVMGDVMTKASRNEHEEESTNKPTGQGIDKLLIDSLEEMVIAFVKITPEENVGDFVGNINPTYHKPLLEQLIEKGYGGQLIYPEDSGINIHNKLIKTILNLRYQLALGKGNQIISIHKDPEINSPKSKTKGVPKETLEQIWKEMDNIVHFIKFVNELDAIQLSEYLSKTTDNDFRVARFLLVREITGRNLMLNHFNGH